MNHQAKQRMHKYNRHIGTDAQTRERERERERELLKRSKYILNYQMKKGIMNLNMLCSSD